MRKAISPRLAIRTEVNMPLLSALDRFEDEKGLVVFDR